MPLLTKLLERIKMKSTIKIVVFFKIVIALILTCQTQAETADQWNSVYILGSYVLTDVFINIDVSPLQACGLTILCSTVKEVADRFYQHNEAYWCRTGDRVFDRYNGFDYKDILRSAIGASLKLTIYKIQVDFYRSQIHLQIRF